MALADVLRERVSRRGRTAEVECGLLGTVTVEALPPRECAALGLRDCGRALFYAACRDLQTAGETLRREGRLFTPAEVTAYVSDAEAAAAARTVLALSGVTADRNAGDESGAADGDGALDKSAGDGPDKKREPDGPDSGADGAPAEPETRSGEGGPSTKSTEVRHENVQNSGAHLAVEAPSEGEIRHGGVQKKAGQKAEVRHEDVRNDAPHLAANAPFAGEFRLADVQENGDLTGKVRHEDVREKAVQKAEIRLEDVRKPDGTAADGQVSHEFFGGDGSDRTDPILGGVSDFVPQNLALSEENDRFSAPLELSGNTEEVSGRGSNLHENRSEVRETVHETKSESAAERREGLHETKSETGETVHETKSDLTTERREGVHESKSEVRETLHEMKSESAAERQEGVHESRSEAGEAVHEMKSDLTTERRENLHESRSEAGETVHESKSESVERFAEGLLEGLRRAAAVR